MSKFLLGALGSMLVLGGCSSQPAADEQTSESVQYADSIEVLDAIWQNIPEDDRFMVVGGYGEDIVENEPGVLPTQDADVAQIFQIPETVLFESVSAASLQHALLANNFTAIVMQFANGTDLESLAKDISEYASTAQWICAIPQEYQILEYGDYLIYLYGSDELDTIFTDSASEVLSGLKSLYDEPVL